MTDLSTPFNERNFAHRFETMGDTAEAQFEAYVAANDLRCDRYGFNRPSSAMQKWPAFIRYTPDFIQHDRLVEVKGVGRDGIVKIKGENLEAIEAWSKIMPIWLFVWNSSNRTGKLFPADENFIADVDASCETDRFPDNNKLYYKIPWDELEGDLWAPDADN